MLKGAVFGIVGGNGWIGRSIGRAMLASGFVDAASLVLSTRSGRPEGYDAWPEVRHASNRELAEQADVIVLAVRPDQFAGVDIRAAGKLVISVMAGVPVASLRARTGAGRIVRALPNAAAEIGRSYTPWFAAPAVSAADRGVVQEWLETFGTGDEVSDESHIDYLTGLTGSGPAFPALLAQALLSHALARGLPPQAARRAVTAVVAGASQLITDEGEAPDMIVRRFVEYRGTTAAGLQAMIDGGFQDAVHAGLGAAEAKALAMAGSRPAATPTEFVNGAVPLAGLAAEHRKTKRENT
jgi:pyrroline-5-carboxylate reductase